MANTMTWANYRSSNPDKGTDEEIQSMIRDVVEAIHKMDRIYGPVASRIVVVALLQDWHSLRSIADARGLTYEHP